LAVVESIGSKPEIACNKYALSSTVLVIGPIWSNDEAKATRPERETRPYVGLIPTTPQNAAGCLIEPPVSDPLTMYANDILTIPVNLAGVPGISVPCGFANGLPLGLQIIGKHFDEALVYRVAHAYEQATDYHKQKPAL